MYHLVRRPRFLKLSTEDQQHAYSHHDLPVVEEASACELSFTFSSRHDGKSGIKTAAPMSVVTT